MRFVVVTCCSTSECPIEAISMLCRSLGAVKTPNPYHIQYKQNLQIMCLNKYMPMLDLKKPCMPGFLVGCIYTAHLQRFKMPLFIFWAQLRHTLRYVHVFCT